MDMDTIDSGFWCRLGISSVSASASLLDWRTMPILGAAEIAKHGVELPCLNY